MSDTNLQTIVLRQDAIAGGLRFYFTGKLCKNGHTANRNAKTRACVECQKERWLESSKKKRSNPEYRAKEREKNRLHQAHKRATDPEFVARKNASNRDAEKAKRHADAEYAELLNKKGRERWAGDPEFRERNKAYVRQWIQENPDKKKAISARRRALVMGAEGTFSDEDLSRINKSQEFRCTYCRVSTAEKFEADHIIPLSRGGSNWPTNIQILCKSCNSHKRARTHEEYLDLLANDNQPKRATA